MSRWLFIALSFAVCCTDAGRGMVVGGLLRGAELVGHALDHERARELTEAEKADVARRIEFFDAPR